MKHVQKLPEEDARVVWKITEANRTDSLCRTLTLTVGDGLVWRKISTMEPLQSLLKSASKEPGLGVRHAKGPPRG